MMAAMEKSVAQGRSVQLSSMVSTNMEVRGFEPYHVSHVTLLITRMSSLNEKVEGGVDTFTHIH